MFCDFLNVWQQHDPRLPDFLGGRVIAVDGACGFRNCSVMDQDTGELSNAWAISGGEVDYNVSKFQQHIGSFETSVFIRMVAGRLEVRGNPSSWGRMDNLFGVGLDEGIAIYNEVLRSLGLPEFTEGEEVDMWIQEEQTWSKSYSGAHVTRVDMTQNLAVGMGNVRHFNKWLLTQKLYRTAPDDADMDKYARWDYSTAVLSDSKFWLYAKVYDKAQALLDVSLPEYLKKLKKAAKAGTINRSDIQRLYKEAEDYLDGLALWCAEQGIARAEWSFKNRWFAQHQGVGFWRPGETEGALLDAAGCEMDKILKRAVVYQEDSFDALTDKEFRVLSDWKRGEDLKDSGKLSKTAFYRFRTSIREKTGLDIAARPVHRTVEARPVFFQVRSVSLREAPIWYQRPSVPLQLAA